MTKDIARRRQFLSICTTGLLTVIAGLILTPAVAFLVSPIRRRANKGLAADDFSDAGALNSIPVGAWTLVPIEIVRQDGWDKTRQARSVWVLVNGTTPGDIKVLSPICPHLGCPIAHLTEKSDFLCPCHGSIFSNAGDVVSGPSPRGMDALESQIRDGHLWIRWQDFRTGESKRIAVQI
jgi:menaquinol-cytochrome c reductase iron-sulfur subunit